MSSIWRKSCLSVSPILVTVSNTSHRGELEGGQGFENSISDKTDFWGSILPIVTLNESNLNSFLISTVSVCLFWCGFILFIRGKVLPLYRFNLLMLCALAGVVFVSQNIRDALLLSTAMLGLGLIEFYSRSNNIFLRYSYVIPLIVSVTFKYPTAVATTLLVITYRSLKFAPFGVIRKFFFIVLASSLVTLAGVSLDKGLANFVNLKPGFPEQSVMLYDLASFYCWSDDIETREKALRALTPVLQTTSSMDICLSHRPNSWIYLVTGGNFADTGIQPPLKQLRGVEDSIRARNLSLDWLGTIKSDPVDYIQFKLITATQVLVVGNPFKYISLSIPQITSIKSFDDVLWFLISLLMLPFAKAYVFSFAFFALVLTSTLLKSYLASETNHFALTLVLIFTIGLATLSLAYVSDEARYVFPLINLLYLVYLSGYPENESAKVPNFKLFKHK